MFFHFFSAASITILNYTVPFTARYPLCGQKNHSRKVFLCGLGVSAVDIVSRRRLELHRF
jgi:hypothetical protein